MVPARHTVARPLSYRRSRIPDHLVLDKLVQVLIFGCAYHCIADQVDLSTTLRWQRDTWIAVGVMVTLLELVLATHQLLTDLALEDLSVDCCITTAPCAGKLADRCPVYRGTQERKRSLAVDAASIPLSNVAASANPYDSPLLELTLDALHVTDAR